jgi:hypothetical protein
MIVKEGNNIGFAITGYLAIGVVIGLTQLGLNKLFEPPCSGVAKHVLWERGYSEDTHFLVRAGSSVLQWLPDLYSRVLKGDMTARDYLLGGYHCEPAVALRPQIKPLDIYRSGLAGGMEPRLGIPPLSSKSLDTSSLKGLGLGGDRPPGSQSADLVKQMLTTTPNSAPVPTPVPTPAPTPNPLESRLKRTGETPTAPQNSALTDEALRNLLGVKQTPSPAPMAQPSPDSQFVTLEALPGVSLAVPRDWLVVGSEEIQQHVTAGEAVYGTGRGIPKTESTMAFRPPTETEGVGIAVTSTPVTLTQQELRTASDAQIREWATLIEREARRGVEAQGLKLLPLADVSREQVGGWLGLAFKARIVDANGTVFEQTQVHVPTTSRTITLNFSYGKGAPPVFKPILAHARETLRIVEPGKP